MIKSSMRWAVYVVRVTREINTEFLSGNLKRKDHLEDRDVDRTMLK
jgi:hypothetical protein